MSAKPLAVSEYVRGQRYLGQCIHQWVKGLAGDTCGACGAFCTRDESGKIISFKSVEADARGK